MSPSVGESNEGHVKLYLGEKKDQLEEDCERGQQDEISPSESQVESAFLSSISSWSKYVHEGEELPEKSLDVSRLISRVPSYLEGHVACQLEKYKTRKDDWSGFLWIEGRSMWSTSTRECMFRDKGISHELLAGLSSRTKIIFTCDGPFQDWPGVADVEPPRQGNCIAVLVLAWCYIFSAQWVELQTSSHAASDAAKLIYLDRRKFSENSDDGFGRSLSIDLGDACEDAVYWWAAILSSDSDWQASVELSGNKYYSPWSVELQDRHAFDLKIPLPEADNKHRAPPPTAIALEYLADFCAQHDAYGQCIAALAVVLLFPYRAGASIELPKLNLESSQTIRKRSRTHIVDALHQHYVHLPRYMSLACYTRGVRALFHGAFYEPGVPCNLSGPWLQGAFHLLDDVFDSKQQSRLIHIMSNRQPALACLWLGASVMKLTDHFLKPIRGGMFAVDMLSAAWTGTVNSFIGPTSTIKSCMADMSISRSDECRLLYIMGAESHTHVPVCPFAPFGLTKLSEADIIVREHHQCNGSHFLQYEQWRWPYIDGGSSASDSGLRRFITPPTSEPESSQMQLVAAKLNDNTLMAIEQISMNATRSVFGWLRPEGHSKDETHIYSHPWFYDFDEDEEQESDRGSDDEKTTCSRSDTGSHRLQDWLGSVTT